MLKKLYTFLTVSAVTFFVCEAWLLTHDPFGLNYFGDVFEYVDELEYNERYSYRHEPNTTKTIAGQRVTTNSYGMRGREPEKKKEDRKRILILGDSVVFGWSVNGDRIFTELLSGDVVSAGVGSWNTLDETVWLKENFNSIAPDEVLLIATSNDMYFKESIEGIKGDRLRSMKKFFVGSFPSIALVYWIYKRVDTRLPSGEEASIAKNALLNLYWHCRGGGVKLSVLLYGTESSIENNFTLNVYRNFLKLLDGVKVYSLPEGLLIPENQISKIDKHLNAKGHWMLAKYIEEKILQ